MSTDLIDLEVKPPKQLEPIDGQCELPYEEPFNPTAPTIRSVDELRELCRGTGDEAEFWEVMALRAAARLKPSTWLLSLFAWPDAIAALQAAERTIDPNDSTGRLRFIESINEVFNQVFEGDGMTTATKKPPAKNAKPKSDESDNELLQRSLSRGNLAPLIKSGATDEQLLVAISEAWRLKLVPGPRKYTVSTSHRLWGTAIWFDTVSQDEQPDLCYRKSTDGKRLHSSLLEAVRGVLNISQATLSSPSSDPPAAKKPSQPKADSLPPGVNVELGQIELKPVDWFTDSPYQKREEVSDEWLDELGDSLLIKQLEPLIVRPTGELISGHTRVRAARRKKIKQLEARIAICDDATAEILVLLYNAKRKDLTQRARCAHYVELALRYSKMGLTQSQLAKALSMSESNLSNELRLSSLPDELWKRQEAGGLTIEQARRLAVHAARESFVAGFQAHLRTIGTELHVQPEPHHFESAVNKGIEKAFRPMKPDMYGGGCLFKPTKDQLAELDIVKVERSGGVEEMAGNVELWNKLNKGAKQKKAEKEAATELRKEAEPVDQKGADKAKNDARLRRQAFALDGTWHIAFAVAMGNRFSGKLKKTDVPVLMRLVIWIQQHTGGGSMSTDPLALSVDDLLLDGDAFHDRALEVVQQFFDVNQQNGWQDADSLQLRKWARYLQLSPGDFWRPTHTLLDTCTDEQLIEWLDGRLPGERAANIETLLDPETWPAGWIPDEFKLERPETKSKKAAK